MPTDDGGDPNRLCVGDLTENIFLIMKLILFDKFLLENLTIWNVSAEDKVYRFHERIGKCWKPYKNMDIQEIFFFSKRHLSPNSKTVYKIELHYFRNYQYLNLMFLYVQLELSVISKFKL